MKLLIISHTPHYKMGETIVGWGATVREIDHLSTLFDEVLHLAPMYSEPAPASAIAYESDRVRFLAVPPAGGEKFIDKLSILRVVPIYIAKILYYLRSVDVIHVRCPANISLLAILLLPFLRRPRLRWIKYAGNWSPDGKDSLSYAFQRWWLKRGWHRGLVTVNGEWSNSPPFVHSFFNPSLIEDEISLGEKAMAQKELCQPLQIVFVGRIENAKGVGRILDIVEQLHLAGITFDLDMIGDGPEREKFENTAKQKGIYDFIHFHGWLPRDKINDFYAKSHFILLPSSSEGWPKVLSEAMAYGAVPIASNVSSIAQYLQHFNTGKAVDVDKTEAFVEVFLWYIKNPSLWKNESVNSVYAAKSFTYTTYLHAVRKLLGFS